MNTNLKVLSLRGRDDPCWRRVLVIIAVVVAAFGCGDDGSDGTTGAPFTPQVSTEKLEIGAHFSTDICTGSIEMLDAQACWMDEAFSLGGRSSLWLYLYADYQEESVVADCGFVEDDSVIGCWDGLSARGVWRATSHELGHAAFSSVNSNPLPFFNECAATLSEGTAQFATFEDRLNISSLLVAESSSELKFNYSNAAHFCRWILEEFGESALVDLYLTTSSSEIDLDTILLSVESSLARPAEDVLAEYANTAFDYYQGLGPFSCGSGEYAGVLEGRIEWVGEMSCSDDATISRYSSENSTEYWRRWTIDVAEEGSYVVNFQGCGGMITRCLQAPSNMDTLVVSDAPVADEWLFNEPLFRWGGLNYSTYDEPVSLRTGVYDVWVAQGSDESNLLFGVEFVRL